MQVSNLVSQKNSHEDGMFGGKADNNSKFGNIRKDQYLGGRAFKYAGAAFTPTYLNSIEYVSISYGGYATDFGDIGSGGGYKPGACTGYGTRIVLNGGGLYNGYDHHSATSRTSSSEFGTEAVDKQRAYPVSNGTRGFWCGGQNPTGAIDGMQYLNLLGGGASIDFGETGMGTGGSAVEAYACGDGSRGLISAGFYPQVDHNYYFNMGTHGSGAATDWGERSSSSGDAGTCAGGGRYIFFGQYGPSPGIDSGNIQTTGSAVVFGQYATKPNGNTMDSDGNRGMGYAGENAPLVQYVTIGTFGNSVDFGEPLIYTYYHGGASGD